MGRTPEQPPVEQPPVEGTNLEEEVAATIAAILIAGSASIVAEIAAALALLLPASIVGTLRSSLSSDIAEVVVEDPVQPPRRSTDNVAAYMDEVAYRAMYGVKAIQRMGSAALQEDRSEAVRKAYEAEKGYYRQHREAQEQRGKGRALNDAAAARFGPILSWNHTGTAKTHRVSHKKASGKNYDVRNPPRSTDGMLPGQAPHCDCVPAPPIRGGRMLR